MNFCFKVCGYLASKWKRIWVEEQQVPFVFQGNIMIGYDDIESIENKANEIYIFFLFLNFCF